MVYQLYLMLVNLVQNKFDHSNHAGLLYQSERRIDLSPRVEICYISSPFKKKISTVTDDIKRGTGTYWHLSIYYRS